MQIAAVKKRVHLQNFLLSPSFYMDRLQHRIAFLHVATVKRLILFT
jgi:hypothetical protein